MSYQTQFDKMEREIEKQREERLSDWVYDACDIVAGIVAAAFVICVLLLVIHWFPSIAKVLR